MHGIPHISHPRSIGAPQPGHSISIPPCKNKNALSPSRDKALGKTLCGTTLGCRGLADTTAHGPLSRADGITPVTRPHLLASSFSWRLQGDFPCRSCPPCTQRQLSSQVSGQLLFLFHARYSITGLSYHILAVCQPIYTEKSRNCSPYADLCTVRTWRTQSRLRQSRWRAAVHFMSDRLASRGSAAPQNFRLLPENPRLLTVVPPWKTLPPERGPSSVLRGVLRTVEWV